MKLIISSEITLLPTPRTKLKEFRALMLKIFAAWLQNEFAVGDTVMDSKTWGLMRKAIAMLPREGGGEWSDLDSFASDYEWVEQTFFAKEKSAKVTELNIEGFPVKTWQFDLTQYQPSVLLEMHYLDCLRLLRDADEYRTTILAPKENQT